ncbi:hypothetical protein [Aulosira sp. FACHB-615]|uniref:hypothetical protein n=1 Tax=Aulosira sp. FACHB-615 TaxID=2692777 RepID=UPI001689BEAE|nr:hypothetical protein [Aulosira sp. FACHB-615]MBD2488958.1 hypothetical protein [Aulosira sp. FACHB-615]
MATAIKAIENCLICILHKRLDSNESLVGNLPTLHLSVAIALYMTSIKLIFDCAEN